MFADVERVLAALAGLLLFTLNEVRMFNTLPRTADIGGSMSTRQMTDAILKHL